MKLPKESFINIVLKWDEKKIKDTKLSLYNINKAPFWADFYSHLCCQKLLQFPIGSVVLLVDSE